MVKAEFLNDLDEKQLKEISKQEGMTTVPKNYEKDDFIKYLEGVLTRDKVKQYRKEYTEREIERDIHIHEKIRERSTREETSETTHTTLSKHEMIFNLQKERIHKYMYQPIADYLHEPIPSGSGVKLYDNMSDKMRKYAHQVFVEVESDKSGRNFEFRCANWLAYKEKEITRIEMRHTFPQIGEIDIVGYDKNDLPLVIAECKDRSVSYEDTDKWLANAEKVAEQFAGQMTRKHGEVKLKAFFFTSNGYSQNVIERVKGNTDKKNVGLHIVNRGFFKDSIYIDLYVYDVRNGKFMKLFP